MAQRTPLRPVRSPSVPATVGNPAQQVRSPAATHVRDGVVLLGLGLAGGGVANLTGHAHLAAVAVAVAVVGGIVLVVTGERDKRRRDLHARLVEALAPLLGVRTLDRRIVTVKRWTRGWPGLPRQLRLRYAPGTQDGPAWIDAVIAAIAGRILGRYVATRHDRRACVLWLRLVDDLAHEKDARPHAQIRLERAITELIGATVTVTGVDHDQDSMRSITVSHRAGAKLAASGYRNRIERVISTMMPGRWRAVWDLECDSVRFEVRPVLPSSVWLPAGVPDDEEDLLVNYRQVKIPYAIDEDGHELAWFPALSPQVMLTGATGSGKTSMAHALLGKITQHGWPVWVLDAKRVEFLDFRDWPNVQIVAGSIPAQVALVRRVWELMEYRYRLIEEGAATVRDFEPLVVFLDEFAEFRNNLIEWYAQIKVKGDPTKPPTLAEVASLARKARTARIHLVLSTQRPDAEFLGGEALATDTPIPTPDGWTTMGEIQVGQQVLAADGRVTTVTATTDVSVGRPCYRVAFSDGSAIATDENHLWAARRTAGHTDDATRIVTTGELADSLRTVDGTRTWAVPVAAALDLPDVDLPIDPWRLGYLLGAGHDPAGAIVTAADRESLAWVHSPGCRASSGVSVIGVITTPAHHGAPLRITLDDGMRDLRALPATHIPAVYLRASAAQRAQLLAGLLDAAGTCTIRDTGPASTAEVSFTSADRRLADGVMELTASLGFVPTTDGCGPAGKDRGPVPDVADRVTRPGWRVVFTADRQVFGSGLPQRILERSLACRGRGFARQREVVAVDRVASVPVRCISVDSPDHLYLTGRAFIPTHNCRDNFGQRISMGRLSPQGAMMMWENPAVGVSLPRACTGRATATRENGVPVEVQCYRFPDLHAPAGSEEQQLLAAIRPALARHPRLVIVPPEADPDATVGESGAPTFRQYAHAAWALAADRPDLDPMARAGRSVGLDGRALSSTLASLGLSIDVNHLPANPHPGEEFGDVADVEVLDAAPAHAEDGTDDGDDEYVGYAPATVCAARELMVGDLIEVEPGSGIWVVVDEQPDDDVLEPGMVAVSWRGDGDESGSMSWADDLDVPVRRPEEDA